MKTYLSLLVLAVFFLASCSSQKDASIAYDDVYYSTKQENNKTSRKDNKEEAIYTASEVYTSSEYIDTRTSSSDDYNYGEENTYSTTEYAESEFEMDDYYDYSYSARIRRFHDPNPGYSYYDNYYTNNYYYEYDPWTYGTSIYSGYNYGYPGYGYYGGSSLYFGFGWGGFGWGYPYYGWRYPYYGWGYPYYSWGWPYYGWGCGCCGYGYNYPSPYYYNSYDYNSYYGPRTNRGSNPNGSGTNGGRGIKSFGEKYEDALAAGRSTRVSQGDSPLSQADGRKPSKSFSQSRTEQRSKTVVPENPSPQARYTQKERTAQTPNDNPGKARQAPAVRQEVPKTPSERFTKANPEPAKSRQQQPSQSKTVERHAKSSPDPRTDKSQERYSQSPARQYNADKNIRSEQRYSKPKTYEAPDYRTSPSQRYKAPANNSRTNDSQQRVSNSRTSAPQSWQSRQSNSQPSNTKTYSTPSRTQSRSYSPPTRSSSKSYSAPSRSSSSPSRSSGSFSSPSRSSGSSGGGSRSSGGSSGGGSRGGRR
jgi:hypothetical protein